MVSMHSWPRFPKSADKIEGAMIAGGDIFGGEVIGSCFLLEDVRWVEWWVNWLQRCFSRGFNGRIESGGLDVVVWLFGCVESLPVTERFRSRSTRRGPNSFFLRGLQFTHQQHHAHIITDPSPQTSISSHEPLQGSSNGFHPPSLVGSVSRVEPIESLMHMLGLDSFNAPRLEDDSSSPMPAMRRRQ